MNPIGKCDKSGKRSQPPEPPRTPLILSSSDRSREVRDAGQRDFARKRLKINGDMIRRSDSTGGWETEERLAESTSLPSVDERVLELPIGKGQDDSVSRLQTHPQCHRKKTGYCVKDLRSLDKGDVGGSVTVIQEGFNPNLEAISMRQQMEARTGA